MELKSYQKAVLDDLSRYLEYVVQLQSPGKAYQAFWAEKNVIVGMNGLPFYQTDIPGVPHVCAKVPTGGGKTYIAASAVKTIFDAMPHHQAKAVVWLVPSDAILSQTQEALSNPSHPYRERLDTDFGNRVQIYTKDQALVGQNLNPSVVNEQLSVFVLSYDSFRTSKKDGRKAYQQNGYLADFAKFTGNSSVLLEDTDETALIQVIRWLNPIVIVDESHHAASALSVEMLQNFNPSFVFDLTATPKKKSNIISFVDAAQLKKANMVKLPVIVYNRKSIPDVYEDAIRIRCKLEVQAKIAQKSTGKYIRPIVLFQAQSRNTEDSTTYDKIKKTLMDAGIPENQIAIKTSDKNELKGVNLMSEDCPVRYIITVNALKEGWDCPFAYVLATVANRTSAVDVEQILGRVLRLPYTSKNSTPLLNLSYVITSSSDFHATLEKVVKGLNDAGFSHKDCRVMDQDILPDPDPITFEQLPIQPNSDPVSTAEPTEADIPEVDGTELSVSLDTDISDADIPQKQEEIDNDPLLVHAIEQNETYEHEIENNDGSVVNDMPAEVRDKMNQFRMNEEFAAEASALMFPQFVMRTLPNIFSQENVLLKKDHLQGNFTLRDKDAQIDFSTVQAEMARIDIDDSEDATPKVWQMNASDSAFYREWFNGQPSEKRLSISKTAIKKKLSQLNCVNETELNEYIDRIIDNLTEDQLSELEQSSYPYVAKIEAKVKDLLEQHRIAKFDTWLEQGKILCAPNYKLPEIISPTTFTTILPKSLYSAEEGMNEYEFKVVSSIASLDHVKWWHRNISRKGFQINGAIHAYPDIIVMLQSGMIVMVETKGDHLENSESMAKAKLGDQWAHLAGPMYRYYMVFESKEPNYPGACSYDHFMELIRGM